MKRSNRFISTGIVSLLLIFTVFCMVILCLLTYQTSRSDYSSAQQTLEQTTAYYEACSKVTELSLELNKKIKELAAASDDAETFLAYIQDMTLPESVVYDAAQHMFFLSVPFSETQELYAELELRVPSKTDICLSVKTWNSRLTRIWEPDLHQNVYLEGESE